MNRVAVLLRFAVPACLACLCLAACSRQPSPAPSADAPEADAPEAEGVETQSDTANPAAEKLASLTDVRRDGGGSIIEVNLQPSELTSSELERVWALLPELPKLRSVRAAETALGDDDLKRLAEVTGLQHLDLRECPISDAGLRHVVALPQLRSIKLSGRGDQTRFTAAGLQPLGQLASLRVVAADFLPVNDETLAAWSDLKQLRELYLAGTEITDRGADTLAGFPNLAKLRVAGTEFSTGGLEQLTGLGGLKELDASSCPGVDNGALEALAALEQLEKLNLYETSVGNGPWQKLGGLTELHWLNVDKTGVGDAALEGIAQIGSLRFLHLGSTQVTDAGLPQLARLESLETLIVTRTAVTAAGVQSLKQQRPQVEIQLEYRPDA